MKPHSHKSLGQFARYILVGGFNTVFGYGVYALLTWSFRGLGSYSYMYAAVLANFIAITWHFSDISGSFFEPAGTTWLNGYAASECTAASALIGLAGLPILVPILRHVLHRPEQAPYIAGALLMIVTVLFSFFGHKNFSFRQKQSKKTRNRTPKCRLHKRRGPRSDCASRC